MYQIQIDAKITPQHSQTSVLVNTLHRPVAELAKEYGIGSGKQVQREFTTCQYVWNPVLKRRSKRVFPGDFSVAERMLEQFVAENNNLFAASLTLKVDENSNGMLPAFLGDFVLPDSPYVLTQELRINYGSQAGSVRHYTLDLPIDSLNTAQIVDFNHIQSYPNTAIPKAMRDAALAVTPVVAEVNHTRQARSMAEIRDLFKTGHHIFANIVGPPRSSFTFSDSVEANGISIMGMIAGP